MRKILEEHKISIFTLAMINVAAIVGLKNLPVLAEYGWGLILYFAIASLVFFIPTSLISAELATGWPKRGGVYIWVKEAFGEKWGFVAIWLQWIENVIWYPTILSFAAGTFAYMIDPALAQNKVYTLFVILISFWGFTLINFMGMKASGLISSVGVISGTIIPGALIIILGIGYLFGGDPLQIPLTTQAFFPDFSDIKTLTFLVGILLSLAGMEMSAVHAQEVKDPQKDFPKAIFLSAGIILLLTVLGSLSIAFVVPQRRD